MISIITSWFARKHTIIGCIIQIHHYNQHLYYSQNSTQHYASLLQSCIARKAIEPGKQLHGHLCLTGLGYNINLATKLVNLYCVCDKLTNAHHLFDRIPKGNIFLWNVLIRGYAWNGPYQAAISLYYQMLDYGHVPDNFTFPFILKACSALSAIDVGKDIHEHAKRTKWDKDVFVGAALIDMYAKCGCVGRSREVFDNVPERDVVVWNSMLAAYSQNGHPEDCLSLCGAMACGGVRPTEATLVTAISASADVAGLRQGRELHGYSWRQGFDSLDKVKTALVDMYAKSGSVKVAGVLFEGLQEKRVVSWNAMITGYAMHGHANAALGLFNEMVGKAQPDHITFVGVLSACNHGGLLSEGRMYFDSMSKDYGIEPTIQHTTCMVDLLGHSGRLDEAYGLIMQMKVMPDAGVWGALLNSCKIHGYVEFAELALERLIELEPDDAGNYVILSNIYAQAGRWEGVAKLRELMNNRSVKKTTAYSWIEVKNKVHAFLSGDTSHPMSDEIYAELQSLGTRMVQAGYVPNITPVFHDVEDDEKSRMVCSHSERLAIAFGLISTPPGTKLLITKNLRVCEDCHVAIKFISKLTEREITIRDVNRYHHFKDGICSCGDYW
ncbi:pentatricopeptide repeat-containing protein CRR2, chloroplastic-like [Solanum dulcamara]|uniref:pentatricopeptide repeat-containing protein CRR2, chloroplastic-like n=1 Tax=Solanum dulcamara TaxID=45834 RepID=UPI00248554C9|nr:pentatricopeptide repeat-containing protein CRR2, chloroplastic-like [Solanum dulcamara]XP_055828532.1 pentatricopeptide repeat-containing protein CRR2, chloroplastic-like [Solanum dulcamara]XP_055828533.1 pentatricopeptide repeat-containing protein CRR2, chloroplastic-like [Solanum dulcamara]